MRTLAAFIAYSVQLAVWGVLAAGVLAVFMLMIIGIGWFIGLFF